MEPVSVTLGMVVAALVAKAGDKAVERAVEGGEGVLAGLLRRRPTPGSGRSGGVAGSPINLTFGQPPHSL